MGCHASQSSGTPTAAISTAGGAATATSTAIPSVQICSRRMGRRVVLVAATVAVAGRW